MNPLKVIYGNIPSRSCFPADIFNVHSGLLNIYGINIL